MDPNATISPEDDVPSTRVETVAHRTRGQTLAPTIILPHVDPAPELPSDKTNEAHMWVEQVRKLYTNNTGHSPIQKRSGNQYIMIA